MRHLFVTNNLGQNAGQIVTPSSLHVPLSYTNDNHANLRENPCVSSFSLSRFFLGSKPLFLRTITLSFFGFRLPIAFRSASRHLSSIGNVLDAIGTPARDENTATNNNNGIIVVAETFD